MAFIPVQHAAMVRIELIENGQGFSINPWFSKTDYTLLDLQSLADAVDQVVTVDLKPDINSSIQYVGSRAYDMRNDQGDVVFVSDGAGNGAAPNDPLPIAVCCVLTLYTAQRGRSGRGRLYFAGFSEHVTEGGLWLQALSDKVELFYSNLVTVVTSIGWTPVVASKYHNGAPRPTAFAYPVTSWAVRNNNFGIQRRRIDRG